MPCKAVLPEYIPSDNVNGRGLLIESYFYLGLSYKEIIGFLLSRHGIRLSIRQLKRVLRLRGLRRRKNHNPLPDVIDVIVKELQGSGSNIGYRLMHQRLRTDHGITIDRETVRKLVKRLDPEGVECRSRKRFLRRKYCSKGPNFIWHVYGYDKLNLWVSLFMEQIVARSGTIK